MGQLSVIPKSAQWKRCWFLDGDGPSSCLERSGLWASPGRVQLYSDAGTDESFRDELSLLLASSQCYLCTTEAPIPSPKCLPSVAPTKSHPPLALLLKDGLFLKQDIYTNVPYQSLPYFIIEIFYWWGSGSSLKTTAPQEEFLSWQLCLGSVSGVSYWLFFYWCLGSSSTFLLFWFVFK